MEIVDFPIENGGSFHSYVSLPEGKNRVWTYDNAENMMYKKNVLVSILQKMMGLITLVV